MAWTKAKMAIVVGLAALLATGIDCAGAKSHHADEFHFGTAFGGRFVVEAKQRFIRQSAQTWTRQEQDDMDIASSDLVLEFQLLSKDPRNNPMVQYKFFRQFRCVYYGKPGIEYVGEFLPDKFEEDSGGYYGYIHTTILPRDSRWLWFRIEKRGDAKRYDSWQNVAEFKIANPARPANLKWSASPTPATNSVDGFDIVLGEITVKTMPSWTNDIWKHVVEEPTQVWENGVLLTNWSPAYVHSEDASGNWGSLQGNISLDPRYVWKLDMDFEPKSNFPDDDLATLYVPIGPGTRIITNALGVPLTFSWDNDGRWLNANMPTNRSDLALKLIGVHDEQGKSVSGGGGSWNQHFFRRSIEPTPSQQVKVDIAIVPNVHTTFYAQPRLIIADAKP